MKDCYKKTLKATIPGELLKLGEMDALISSQNNSRVVFYFSSSVDYAIDGVGDSGASATVNTNAGEKTISIYDKYKVERIEVDTSISRVANIDLTLNDLEYASGLTRLPLADATGVKGDIRALAGKASFVNISANSCAEIEGDISVFSGLPSLTDIGLENAQLEGSLNSLTPIYSHLRSFVCNSPKISGTIDSFSSFTQMLTLIVKSDGITGNIEHLPHTLSRVYIPSTKVEGSLETWLAAIYNDQNNPKRSGTITVDIKGSRCTFHNTIPRENYYYAVFGADGITVKHALAATTPLATYDGSSWSYT